MTVVNLVTFAEAMAEYRDSLAEFEEARLERYVEEREAGTDHSLALAKADLAVINLHNDVVEKAKILDRFV